LSKDDLRPLAERLVRTGHGAPTPSWLDRPAAAPRTRPLGPKSEKLPPVPQPAENVWRAEVETRIEDARAAAEREGRARAEAEIARAIHRYGEAIQTLSAATRVALRPDAGEVVELALLIAGELAGRALHADKEALARRLDAVFAEVAAPGGAVVRVSPADAAELRRLRPELMSHGTSIIEDPAIGPGGLVIETPQAVIDATVAARLKAARAQVAAIVADALRGVEP
jgi:flagellar biosynthesis/type III secretory pathway protein FliH